MNKQAVIDSNVLVALTDSRDKWHSQAQTLLNSLEVEDVRLIYLDCVLNETISVMARRAEEQQRSHQFSALLNKFKQQIIMENITWISPEIPRMYPDVIGLIEDTSGKLNFNDSLIALFCKEFAINVIISFDRDFDMIEWLRRISEPSGVKTVFTENAHNL